MTQPYADVQLIPYLVDPNMLCDTLQVVRLCYIEFYQFMDWDILYAVRTTNELGLVGQMPSKSIHG